MIYRMGLMIIHTRFRLYLRSLVASLAVRMRPEPAHAQR